MDEQAELQRKASALLRDLDEAEFLLNRQIAAAEKEMEEGRAAVAELNTHRVRRFVAYIARFFQKGQRGN